MRLRLATILSFVLLTFASFAVDADEIPELLSDSARAVLVEMAESVMQQGGLMAIMA